jgi:outer membrane protein
MNTCFSTTAFSGLRCRPSAAWTASLLVLGCSVLFTGAALAQGPDDFDAVVERYVAEGLRTNLALQGETLEVEKAASALAAARARFFPEVAVQSRYSRSEGGREFALPLGMTLNPVYATLNDLLVAQGQPTPFKPVSDVSIPFLREQEQETRLTLRQPLYAPAIAAAVRAQSALLEAGTYHRMAIARTLRRDITTAYVNWLNARNSMEIVGATEALLQENLRVNTSLFDNGKITEDQVLRAKAELLEVEQQRREAANRAIQAQSFFNFLLNRELRAEIDSATLPDAQSQRSVALEQLWEQALSRRPELAEMQRLQRASAHQTRAAEQQRWPTLSLGIDAGTQGEAYRFGNGYDFSTVSLVFSWRLFDAGSDAARVRQARATQRQLVLRDEEIAQQIRLEVQQAFDRLQTTRDSLVTAGARVEAARAAFRIASRKRDEGVISQVEFIDARSTLTRAELNYSLTRCDLLARRADLEYATAAGSLPFGPDA